jgi:hypothetical protein
MIDGAVDKGSIAPTAHCQGGSPPRGNLPCCEENPDCGDELETASRRDTFSKIQPIQCSPPSLPQPSVIDELVIIEPAASGWIELEPRVRLGEVDESGRGGTAQQSRAQLPLFARIQRLEVLHLAA